MEAKCNITVLADKNYQKLCNLKSYKRSKCRELLTQQIFKPKNLALFSKNQHLQSNIFLNYTIL